MAKRLSFPTRAKGPKRKARTPFSAGTFIQRSRNESSEQKAIWNDPSRHFFGLSDEETEKCRGLLAGSLDTRLRELSQ